MSTSSTFLKELGHRVADRLDGGYKFYSSKLELRRKNGPGFDVIIFGGSNKRSPEISISFYVGRRFDAASKLEKDLGIHSPPYHIQQYSPAAPKMEGLDYSGAYTWSFNIQEPPDSLVDEICAAIRGIGEPFFDRFREIEAARSALINGSSWCFSAGGHYWHTLFSLDAVTGNIDHFATWMRDLDPLYQEQATERLSMLQNHSTGAS